MTDKEFREKLIDALRFIGGGELSGPSGLEGLAMAMAGKDFITRENDITSALYAIAGALERIADHLEAEGKL
jgi:hypothetical protein